MNEWIYVSTHLPTWFYHIGAAILGLLLGSFLNVVVYRLPISILHPAKLASEKLSLSRPASHCPSCKRMLRWWHNIPLFSWVALQGKCHFCRVKISVIYPLTEGFCCVVFTVMSLLFSYPSVLAGVLILFWFLLALSLIDLSSYLLPDTLTLPLLWAGLLINAFSGELILKDTVYGATAGYLCLWCLFWVKKIMSGREGMGYGDFKLLAALGAWVGWQMLPHLCILAAATGIVFVLLKTGANKMLNPIPFGPSLSFAGFVIYISQKSEPVWLFFKSFTGTLL